MATGSRERLSGSPSCPEGSTLSIGPAEAKRTLNEQFARVAKAVAHPKRIELLELMAQAERPVDSLSEATGMGVSNTSAHLQVLRRARLVETRREGTQIFYRLASPEVSAFVWALRSVASAQLAEIGEVTRDYFESRDVLEPVARDDLLQRASDGEVVVVDVRPAVEYRAGHIPGASSIPLNELADRLDELPADAEVVAYCRGPYCVLAVEAVAMLRERGHRARRLEDGWPQWRAAGLPIATDDHDEDRESAGLGCPPSS
jgi:rhodanese-related sulfurtransferase